MSKRGTRWTTDEDDFLEFAFNKGLSFAEMEKVLEGRTQNAIRSRIVHTGLRRNFPKREKDGLIRCSHCKKYKSPDNFIKLSNGKYYCYCNECKRILSKQRYLKKKKEKALNQIRANEVFKTKIEANEGAETKICSRCGVEKDVEDFYWEVKGKKLSGMCRDCKKELNKKYKEKNLRTRGF